MWIWWINHKKKVIAIGLVLLLLMTAIFLSRRINPLEVEKIVFATHHGHGPVFILDETETKKFIWLYNTDNFSRIPPDGETTPDYMVFVFFNNGTVLEIGNTGDRKYDFEIGYRNANGKRTSRRLWCANSRLEAFLEELEEKYG